MYLYSLKNNYCPCCVLILHTTWEMQNLKRFVVFFYSKRTLNLQYWSNAKILFVCLLQHLALNHWCSGYSHLSLCRHVFTRVNSIVLPLLISKPQFSCWFFLSDVGVSRRHTYSQASYHLLLGSCLGKAVMCTQPLPVQIQQMPPRRAVLPAGGGARGSRGAARLWASPLASPAI